MPWLLSGCFLCQLVISKQAPTPWQGEKYGQSWRCGRKKGSLSGDEILDPVSYSSVSPEQAYFLS